MDVVANAVLRSRVGLSSQSRGSSFLFLGPTGVGKTELAKALAELLFDDEKMMVRLDMSEYMEVRHVPSLVHPSPLFRVCPLASCWLVMKEEQPTTGSVLEGGLADICGVMWLCRSTRWRG